MSQQDVVDLDDLAARTLEYADKLRTVSQRFNGYEHDGVKYEGVKLQFDEAIDAAKLEICDPYLENGKRPPAEDLRMAMARKKVKQEKPALYVEYHQLEASMKRIERWLQDARTASIARQSVLKTERELAGRVSGPNGEVIGRRAA